MKKELLILIEYWQRQGETQLHLNDGKALLIKSFVKDLVKLSKSEAR